MSQDFSEAPKAISSQLEKKNTLGRGCLAIFFSIFFLVGLAILFFLSVLPLWHVLEAQGWVSTACTIASSELVESGGEGEDSPAYRIAIVYDYEFDGQPYRGDKYSFAIGSTSGHASKKRIVDQHPAGSIRSCFVNPDNPSEAVIHRGVTGDMFIGLIGVPFFLAGLIGLLFAGGMLGRRRARSPDMTWSGFQDAAVPREIQRNPFVTREPVRDAFAMPDPAGSVTLKAASSPLGKLLGLILICLFWNGIVSIFVSFAVHGFVQNKPEWFLTFFLIPFVLIGLLLVYGVFHSFLSLFNPRPIITLDPGTLKLGESARVAWRFTGQSGSIQQLRIVLEGKEEATYRQGTNTRTDTAVFAELPIVDTQDMVDVLSGERELAIPLDSMHSFSAGNNKITWTLKLHGKISFWPDIDDQYVVTVRPRSIEGGFAS